MLALTNHNLVLCPKGERKGPEKAVFVETKVLQTGSVPSQGIGQEEEEGAYLLPVHLAAWPLRTRMYYSKQIFGQARHAAKEALLNDAAEPYTETEVEGSINLRQDTVSKVRTNLHFWT